MKYLTHAKEIIQRTIREKNIKTGFSELLKEIRSKSITDIERELGFDNIEPIRLTKADSEDMIDDDFREWYEKELREVYADIYLENYKETTKDDGIFKEIINRRKCSASKELQDELDKITAGTKLADSKDGIVQLHQNNTQDKEWYEDDEGLQESDKLFSWQKENISFKELDTDIKIDILQGLKEVELIKQGRLPELSVWDMFEEIRQENEFEEDRFERTGKYQEVE